MHTLSRSRTLRGPAGLMLLVLAACGGGGSDPPAASAPPVNNAPPDTSPPPAGAGATFSSSANTLTFSALNRIGTPPPQRIPVTVSGNVSGSFNITAQLTGDAIGASHVTYSQRNGQVTIDALIYPPGSGTLSPGTYQGTVTLNACVNDSTCQSGHLQGSPLTVNVVYTVEEPVQGDIVAPRIATAGEPGTAILRGRGFNAVTSVRFGSVEATSVRVIGTEIRATYPALVPGEYPVALNSGAVAFTGSLLVLDAPVYEPDVLEYAAAPPQDIGGVVYDAQRSALIVVGQNADRRNNTVTRFQFARSAASNTYRLSDAGTTPVPDIQDLTLFPDGSMLLGATSTSLIELNPVTILPTNGTTPATYSPADDIKSGDIQKLAITNDGYAVVTTGGSGPTNVYLYSPITHAFHTLDFAFEFPLNVLPVTAYFGSPAVSGDGSILAMTQDQGPSRRPGVHRYDAALQHYSLLPVPELVDRDRSQPLRSARPALDRAGTRIVLNGASTVVVDRDYATLGRLPDSTRAAVVKPDASRVYTFDAAADSASGELRTFDLTAPPVDGMFQQVGPGIPMSPGSATGTIAMALTPDGGTVFVVGTAGAWVQPLPQ
jgi:hypothetical protein